MIKEEEYSGEGEECQLGVAALYSHESRVLPKSPSGEAPIWESLSELLSEVAERIGLRIPASREAGSY